VTGEPAKYRDPVTGAPYATVEAFRALRAAAAAAAGAKPANGEFFFFVFSRFFAFHNFFQLKRGPCVRKRRAFLCSDLPAQSSDALSFRMADTLEQNPREAFRQPTPATAEARGGLPFFRFFP